MDKQVKNFIKRQAKLYKHSDKKAIRRLQRQRKQMRQGY